MKVLNLHNLTIDLKNSFRTFTHDHDRPAFPHGSLVLCQLILLFLLNSALLWQHSAVALADVTEKSDVSEDKSGKEKNQFSYLRSAEEYDKIFTHLNPQESIEDAHWNQWEQLSGMAELCGSDKFCQAFHAREASAYLGPFLAHCLRDPSTELIKACESFAKNSYGEFFRQMGKVDPKSGEVDQAVFSKISGLVSQIAENLCPVDFNQDDKGLQAGMFLWLYIIDDLTVKFQEKLSVLPLGGHLAHGFSEKLLQYYGNCWKAGLRQEELPPRPRLNQLIWGGWLMEKLSFGQKLSSATMLGKNIYDCASELGNCCPQRKTFLQDTQLITLELLQTLKGMADETQVAPETPEEYMKRHAHSGGTRVVQRLMLNQTFWKRGIPMDHMRAPHIDEQLFQELLAKADFAMLKGNESVAAKDMGEVEESYIAVKIAQLIRNPTDELRQVMSAEELAKAQQQLRIFSLKQAKNHGRILQEFLGTPLGFLALQDLAKELSQELQGMVMIAKKLIDHSQDKQAAAAVAEVLLRMGMSTQFFYPTSTRYGPYFTVFAAALQNDLVEFAKAVGQVKNSSK